MSARRFTLLLALSAAPAVWAQEGVGRIWQGVYTAEQAERGKAGYIENCSNCHNLDLNGSVRGPTLKGERFMRSWENTSVNDLFVKLRDSMPATYPETVPAAIKIDILTFLLQQNSFPAGEEELKIDLAALEDILIVAEGQSGIANFAHVAVLGCLAPGANDTWTLTQTTEPEMAREGALTEDALQTAKARPLGNETFQLVSAAAFHPESHSGEKVAARGLLYREPGENRLNLTSLEAVGSSCR